jgi:hypothetical protein
VGKKGKGKGLKGNGKGLKGKETPFPLNLLPEEGSALPVKSEISWEETNNGSTS